MKTYLTPSHSICNFSSLLAVHSCFSRVACENFHLLLIVHVLALIVFYKIRTRYVETTSRAIGDVTSYRMEQGLSNGTGYINCYLTCRKFTCQLHLIILVPAPIRFKRHSISVRRINICFED